MNNLEINENSRENGKKSIYFTSINELTGLSVKNQNKRVFGIENSQNNEKINEIIELSSITSSFLNNDEKPIDEHGRRIINYSPEKKWFLDNISFIFATGLIFDDNDTKKLDNVLRCFNDLPNQAYLNNTKFILDYNDELVKSIESTCGIKNGNYHILFTVINSANEELIKTAPSNDFNHIGTILVSTKWEEIINKISEYVSNYGLIYEYFGKSKADFKHQQRISRDNLYNPNPSISVTDVYFSEIKDLPGETSDTFKFNKKENMRTGKAFLHNQRGDREDYQDPRLEKGKDLYSRINNDVQQSLPTKQVGGVMKMDLYKLPESEQKSEFVIYDLPGTYSIPQGNNLFGMTNPMTKADMPNFSSFNASGMRNRKVIPTFNYFPK